MKKKYKYIIIALVLTITVLWWTRQQANPDNSTPDAPDDHKGASRSERAPNRPSLADKVRTFHENADTAIDFYGRVIDQNGRGIGEAIINYQLERTGLLMADGKIANNNEKSTSTSAADGSFSIQRARGLTLRINIIEKAGYRDSGQNVRSFGYRGTPDPHIADAKKPVDFLIIDENVPKAKIIHNKEIEFSWNRGPVEFLIPNVGKFVLLPTRTKQAEQIRDFNWNLVVSMDGAELTKIDRGAAEIAPEEGYQKSFQYGSEQGNPKWGGAIQERYAFRTSSNLYGVIDLHLVARRPDGEQQGSLEVRINETGARNLDR